MSFLWLRCLIAAGIRVLGQNMLIWDADFVNEHKSALILKDDAKNVTLTHIFEVKSLVLTQ